MTCLDISAGGEFVCPSGWFTTPLTELPYTGLVASLAVAAVLLVVVGVLLVRRPR